MPATAATVARMAEARKGLVPRTFYFLMEHSDLYNPTPSESVDKMGFESYRAEVAFYRVDPTTGQLDDGTEPRILRSWNHSENNAFRYSLAERDTSGAVVTPVQFEQKLSFYPEEGILSTRLPALVVVCDLLEPLCEYVAIARLHDGLQWGPWARIAQTRLAFIDEQDEAVLDLPQSDPHPEIDALVVQTEVARAAYLAGQKTITVQGSARGNKRRAGERRDFTDITKVYVNGQEFVAGGPLPAGSARLGSDHGSGQTFKRDVAIEACTRIEVVAENSLGNRSHAVKIFLPEYKAGDDDTKGRVEKYYALADPPRGADGQQSSAATFRQEAATQDVSRFRLLYQGIPYLPTEMLFTVQGGSGHRGPLLSDSIQYTEKRQQRGKGGLGVYDECNAAGRLLCSRPDDL